MGVKGISGKRKMAAGQNVKERDYWLKKLSGDLEKSFFPYDYNDADLKSPGLAMEMETMKFRLSSEVFQGLVRLSNKSHQRLFMVLVTGLVVLLEKHTGNKDIMVGVPIYKQDIQGDFINTVLVLRLQMQADSTFKQLVLQVRQALVEAVEHQNYPLEALLYKLNLPTSEQGFPLFDAAILLENIHDQDYLKHIKCNLVVSFRDTGQYLEGTFKYNRSRYRKTSLERIAGHFNRLFRSVLSNFDVQLAHIDILTENEKKQVLVDFNRTHVQFPQDKIIHQLLEIQVEKTPDHTAVVYRDQYLTFQGLNEKANQLAWVLRKKGVKPGIIVAIILEPSQEMVTGIVGILKAGGAYLPIDPGYPDRRIISIIQESQVPILLTKANTINHTVFTYLENITGGHVKPVVTPGRAQLDFNGLPLPDRTLIDLKEYNKYNGIAMSKKTHQEVFFLDNILEELTYYPGDNPVHNTRPGDLVYLISTSGSTGIPKCVMLEHRNLANLLNFQYCETAVDFSRVLQFASIGFDVSAQEIFSALLSGSELYLIDNEMKGDILRLFDLIRANGIGTVFWPPAFLKLVFSHKEYISAFPRSIRHIITAGEQLMVTESLREYLRNHPVCLHNHYGPAETHVVTTFTMGSVDRVTHLPPIGRPISNTRIYILDENKNPTPVNAVGELYIAGNNVGRGYMNRPELTFERFVRESVPGSKPGVNRDGLPARLNTLDDDESARDKGNTGKTHHPSSQYSTANPLPHSIMYKTGDLARWLPDSNIEFFGRTDHQVKVRGFRVELEEIEKHLMAVEFVKEAVVVDIKDSRGDKYLCAYIVSEKEADPTGYRQLLSERLPDYMIPAYFERVESIPLTPNGKVDRKALPLPLLKGDETYIAPRDDRERKLVDIWSEVLGIEKDKIGIEADFFELGGHSLKATILITKIHKVFNMRVTLAEMFEQPTISGLSRYLKVGKGDIFTAVAPVEKKEYYPVSSAQKRLYILQQLKIGNMAYNNPVVTVLEGDLSIERVENTFRKLIKRHETLRTSLEMVGQQPVQRVHQQVGFSVPYIETAEPGIEKRTASFKRPFDLSQPPLLRVELIKVGENRFILMFDMHHIITDGTSMQVLVKEFMASYGGEELPPLRIQYRDFSAWQNKKLETGDIEKQQKYWLEQLDTGEEIPVLNMPADYIRPDIQGFEGNHLSFHLGSQEYGALMELAKEKNATLYMVLLSIFNVLLSRTCGQEDIIVGTPIAGRRHADLQYIIGMFVNTLVMRNYPLGEKTFAEFLNELREQTLGAFENQDYPFEDLVDRLAIRRDTGRNPLFDVLFVLQNMSVQPGEIPEVEIPQLKILPYSGKTGPADTKFDMTLAAAENQDGLSLVFAYNIRLFRKETIERFITYFKLIAAGIVKNPGEKISGIDILAPAEKNRILFDFNKTGTRYPGDKTIHQLFEEQAEQIPHHTAVVDAHSNHFISYKELNRCSRQLAHVLIEKSSLPGVSRNRFVNRIVGIMLKPCLETIAGILGILKSGGAYLPIDPDYPQERVQYMLKDSRAKMLLTREEIANLILPGSPGIDSKDAVSVPAPAPSYSTSPGDIAYVLYTSGTTGKPKGVMIEHGSVVNILYDLFNRYPFFESGTYLAKTSYVFDVSVSEIFGWFLGGGRLAILDPGGEKDPVKVLEIVERMAVTHINFVPSMFRVFVDTLDSNPSRTIRQLSSLRYIFLAGEALSPVLVNRFRDLENKICLENIYGPTEGTVYTTKYSLDSWDRKGNPPIGQPLNNIKAYIFTGFGYLQPVGIAGELCLSGTGLARGYLNRPELTSVKFIIKHSRLEMDIPHMGHIPDVSRLYRTGDSARWLSDGNIEFLGRIDNQVKLRGYRIEPEEIENVLLMHDNIKEVVVVAGSDDQGDKYLCAYIVSGKKIEIAGLREYLSKRLPDYMVPSYWLQIGKIPLTPNGKLDRNALPEPEIIPGPGYSAPRDKIEEKLAGIWREVLGVKGVVGIDDNFFELGGHSLKATIMAAKIHRELNVILPLTAIFKTPRIKGLAAFIREMKEERFVSINPVEKKEYYVLSSAQQRLYILQQMELTGTVYNMPLFIPLPGKPDREKLTGTFTRLIKRHESLRTSFELVEDEAVQKVHHDVEFEIRYYEAGKKKEKEKEEGETEGDADTLSIIRHFISPFDLSRAPLLRIGLLKTNTADAAFLLMVDMHHIISDATSHHLLMKDTTAIAAGETLPLLRLQYKDFSEWQNSKKEIEKLRQQEDYWLKEFGGQIPLLDMPLDYDRPAEMGFEGSSLAFRIDPALTGKLRKLASQLNVTMMMLLLSGYKILLSKYTGQEELIVGTVIAGRRHADLENIMGFFVNMLAIKTKPGNYKQFSAYLSEVKEKALNAYENQDYPFEELVGKLRIQRVPGRHPLIDTVFVLAETGDRQGEEPGEGEKQPAATNTGEGYANIYKKSHFDLMLHATAAPDSIHILLEYSSVLFKEKTIDEFSKYYREILQQVVENKDIKLKEIKVSHGLQASKTKLIKDEKDDWDI